MLLTKTEQEKLRIYVIYNMLKEQKTIRTLFNDVDNELTFIDNMIEQNYKRAFDLCCAVFEVYTNEVFIQNVLDYIYPELRKEQAEYNIFIQNVLSNDFAFEDKLIMYKYDKLATLQNIIFD